MKSRLLSLVAVLLISGLFLSAGAQTYERLWKDAAKMEKKDLPKSALKITESIYAKALKERNTPEMMKAYLMRMQYRQTVAPDSLEVDVKGLEKWAREAKEPLDAAVLHSLLGEIYGQYLSTYRFNNSAATAITEVPEEMDEWSRNVFVQKMVENFRLSLKAVELLGKTSDDAFRSLVIQGDAGKYYHHDLLHLLGMRAITSLSSNSWHAGRDYQQTAPKNKIDYWGMPEFLDAILPQASEYDCIAECQRIYQTMLRYYQAAGNSSAIVLTNLARLDFLSNYLKQGRTEFENPFENPYYTQLQQMQQQYASEDVCTEVYIKMVAYAHNHSRMVEALRLAREGIAKYPRYNRINVLKNHEASILQPRVNVRLNSAVYPMAKLDVNVSYRNLSSILVRIYQINLPADSEKLSDVNKKGFLSSHGKLLESKTLTLTPTSDYLNRDTVWSLTAPQEGVYAVEITSKEKTEKPDCALIYSSKLQIISRMLPDKQTEFVVVDAQSGHPVSQAKLTVYKKDRKGNNQALRTLTTDDKGTVTMEKGDANYVRAQKGSDLAMQPTEIGYAIFREAGKQQERKVVRLFTDRAVYRPGQTVYVSGLAYTQEGDSTRVAENREYDLKLLDVNNQVVGEKKVRSNEFGSFAGEFILPSPCLTGQFLLRADDGRTSIRVEEYKRPTFEVSFLPVDGAYQAGDSVWVKGVVKTFSGVPVQQSEVKYQVDRRTPMFWRWGSNADKALASGEVRTNDAGEFSIRVFLEPDTEQTARPVWYSTYQVEATVTDAAGETQNNSLSLQTGSSSLTISTNLPVEIQKSSAEKFTFFLKNLAGQPIQTTGEYAVYELDEKQNKPFSPTYGRYNLMQDETKLGKQVLKSDFTANEPMDLNTLKALPTGLYRLTLTAKDEQGRVTTFNQNLILYALDDKRPPYTTNDWFRVIENQFGHGKDGVLVFGSSAKDVYVLYDVFSGDKRLESKRLHLTDSVMKMTFPYKEAYAEGILVQFSFVKDGQLYSHEARFTKVAPDKKLEMKWEVFRDKLTPGQKEEWKMSIRYPNGKPAEAELLATMYDASLDQIAGAHSWNLDLFFPRFLPYTTWSNTSDGRGYLSLNFPLKELKYNFLEYDRLMSIWYGYRSEIDRVQVIGYAMSPKSANRLVGRGMAADKVDQVLFESEVVSVEETGTAAQPQQPEQQPRTNFAETAFFYPQLRTNAQGEVSFSFLLPESLTEWKFMGLSHTRNMDWEQLTAKTVASKEFMLQPNMPRFVRVGDRTTLAATVMNLSAKNVSGTVRMELFDPETDQVFLTQKQKFSVEAGKTAAVSFTFLVDETVSVMACRMIADGGTFSDGEQRYIPVLPKKEWITESLPMALDGKETKKYSLAGLFNNNSKTATDRRLTIEFTGNPAWYAVQALPSLGNPTDESAISWVSAYYANRVSASIAQANPRIKSVFDAWKAQGGTKETLWSNLQKNQELKNILLDQSPWVAEATNEADRKQRLSLLFDLNTLQNKDAVAIDKLQKLQLADGAWSWYKGMTGSRYITQFIVETLARMQVLTGDPLAQDAQRMYAKAFDYLHNQALEEYKSMRKAEKEGAKELQLSELTVHYLYVCALTDCKLPAANKQANDFFIEKLAKMSRQETIYGKAISAIILQKAGKTADARNFMASLKEYAVETKEMGMYYDTRSAHYSPFNYKIPTQVAVVEAMEQVSKDTQAVEQLKLWLLKQKQTQAWDTPLSTVDAIYALLQRGTDLLARRGEVKILLGNNVMETSPASGTATAGLGYVKETFAGKELSAKLKEVVVEKQDAGIAWGAVYAQYLEDPDQVSRHEGSLSVDKKLYVESRKDGRAELTPLSQVKTLKVGDKVVVRLTIRTDRDMDFVQLKDQTAACFEPLTTLSGYRWQSGMGCYVAVKDASMEYFFEGLRKGTHLVESSFYVARNGDYASGLATVQSAYAPEFSANSVSVRVQVGK